MKWTLKDKWDCETAELGGRAFQAWVLDLLDLGFPAVHLLSSEAFLLCLQIS